jgi:hypothetical protein
MIRFVFPIVTIAAIMSMGACSGTEPVADEANNAGTVDISVLPPDESATTTANELDNGIGEQSTAPPTPAGKIPAALHGRWGMTPGDCSSTRGDAKGLLTINADSLKFYESVARPAGRLATSADSASGDFVFTGEGMTWKKYQALEMQNNKLVRTESDPMMSFTYARCAG